MPENSPAANSKPLYSSRDKRDRLGVGGTGQQGEEGRKQAYFLVICT